MNRLRSVSVVVPARDEELVLDACLRSVLEARDTLRGGRPELEVRVVVVLDRCVDGSAAVVAGHPSVESVVVAAGCVGVARAVGCERSLDEALGRGGDLTRTWLVSTDADTVVPPAWLVTQVRLAEEGRDLVLGTVEPQGVDGHLLTRWRQRNRLREGHPHVHGANLGVRGSRYVEAGGFPAVDVHEDVLLAEAVKASGAPWVATDTTRVRTAGRLDGRVDGGFATYLRDLAAELPTPVTTAASSSALCE